MHRYPFKCFLLLLSLTSTLTHISKKGLDGPWNRVMYFTCGFSCQAGGKECPFLACGIRVCSFSRTSDILICVIGEKIYVVFREGISECLAQNMELNCQAIVDLWLQFWKSLGSFFSHCITQICCPLYFSMSVTGEPQGHLKTKWWNIYWLPE